MHWACQICLKGSSHISDLWLHETQMCRCQTMLEVHADIPASFASARMYVVRPHGCAWMQCRGDWQNTVDALTPYALCRIGLLSAGNNVNGESVDPVAKKNPHHILAGVVRTYSKCNIIYTTETTLERTKDDFFFDPVIKQFLETNNLWSMEYLRLYDYIHTWHDFMTQSQCLKEVEGRPDDHPPCSHYWFDWWIRQYVLLWLANNNND